jgi:hypothetical protein
MVANVKNPPSPSKPKENPLREAPNHKEYDQ